MYLFRVCLLLISIIPTCKGSCPTAPLFAFIQNSTIASTMSIAGAYNLPNDPTNSASVLSGAFVPMNCNTGYVLATGQLNITCVGTAWTPLPTCVMSAQSISNTLTAISQGSGAPCTIDITTTFNITNGYPTSLALSYISNNTATGSIQFACVPGYALDPNVGASYICTNGQWSIKPRCLITGRCSFPQLQTFLTNAVGIQTTGQESLMQLSTESGVVLNGSYIVFSCANGYVNNGGSLNVTCSSGGAWSSFPNCVSGSGGGVMPTTTMATGNNQMTTTIISTGNASPCVVNIATTFNITNGYAASLALSYMSNTTAKGSIQFACVPGYALDPNVGASYICTNGQWSIKPRCLITGRCSFPQLQTFLTSAVGIQTTGQASLMQLPTESGVVLNGSYIVFSCANGYVNNGGSLNVTCSSAGAWSPFPNCVSGSGGGVMPTTTMATGNNQMTTTIISTGNGSPCVVDITTTFNITNGYAASLALSYVSSTTATGSILFACVPGYALDPTVGASYTCTNGQWSIKPRCLITGRCSFPQLQTFLTSAVGIQTTGQASLMQLSTESGVVLNGSYIVFSCANGYMNNGGSLNVTCSSGGAWSPFPNCVSGSGGGVVPTTTMATGNNQMTTTIISTGNGSPCVVDITTTFNITNGYAASLSLSYMSSTTATGSILFACVPGYALDPTVGASYTCNNGQWSTKPQCLRTGRCSFSQLQTFLTTTTGIQTTGQTSILELPTETGLVLNGSYIVFSCMNGYVNNGGSLNVTCSTTGSWSPFPNCVSSSGGGVIPTTTIATGNNQMTTTIISTGNGSPCVVNITTTFNITNGYPTTLSLLYLSDTMATGSIQFACGTGYVLDPSVGATYVCNNGQWSTKPRCLITGRCSFSQLQTFLTSAVGIQPTGQTSLPQLSTEAGLILNGSYIVFSCMNGYVNNGGSLNVTCSSSGSWSQFPNCVSGSGGGVMPTTTMATGNNQMTTTIISTGNGSPCVVDITTTFNITNGYAASLALSYVSSTTATGSIQFACVPGYALDPNVGASYICTNGQWSIKPRCLITGRCSFPQLQTFLTSAVGIQTTGQASLMQLSTESGVVLNGSYIVFSCANGYVNNGGSLNVTCSSGGAWSSFPNCVSGSGGGVMPTTTMATGNNQMTTTIISTGNGSPCVVDVTTTFNITNGYAASLALSYVSSTTATGSIQFACVPGYALDPNVGASYICTNGQWSIKPRCLITGRCSFPQLQTFLTSAVGIQTTGQASLMQLSTESGVVLNGSYIVFSCANGYMNNGGSLNVTCSSSGAWSQFPNCVPGAQATTVATTAGVGQVVTTTLQMSGNCASIPVVANGYVANATSINYGNNTYVTRVEYACNPGFVHVNTSGKLLVSCTNGVWNPLPVCTTSPTCSMSELQSGLPFGIAVVSSGLHISSTNTAAILAGSWLQINCVGNYKWNPTSGPLNITCLSTGQWTTFPTCYQ